MHELNEKCGVFGVFGHGMDVARLAFFGLLSIQHRGQESAGIAVSDGARIECRKGNGLVTQIFNEESVKEISGHIAIGHNRYSTSQGSDLQYAQPIQIPGADFVFAHNGNLPSVKALEAFLGEQGIATEGHSDSYMMALAVKHYIDGGASLADAMQKAYPLFTGSFSVVAMDKTSLVATRDRYGIKPFSLAKMNGGFILSSETCTFGALGATFMRDVAPGEMIVIDESGLKSVTLAPADQKLDIFEFVYFSKPSSQLLGQSVYLARERCGEILAKESNVEADVVVPLPETAIPAAIGYARASGIPFELGLIKNRYVYRTFIQPESHMREQSVKYKLAPLPELLAGKRVILVDDSIVRGTTSRQIIKAVFDAGAKEVHFMVNSPTVRYPDFYGIDTPDQSKLLAFDKTIEQMREYLGATSLHFLSYKGLLEGLGVPEDQLCTSCFTGIYPLDILERKADVRLPAVPEIQ